MVYVFPERCKWCDDGHHCVRFHIGIGRHQQVLGCMRALMSSLQTEGKDVQTVVDIDVVLSFLKE